MTDKFSLPVNDLTDYRCCLVEEARRLSDWLDSIRRFRTQVEHRYVAVKAQLDALDQLDNWREALRSRPALLLPDIPEVEELEPVGPDGVPF